jgi:hypothetical protein
MMKAKFVMLVKVRFYIFNSNIYQEVSKVFKLSGYFLKKKHIPITKICPGLSSILNGFDKKMGRDGLIHYSK